jgi:hypothetical protein
MRVVWSSDVLPVLTLRHTPFGSLYAQAAIVGLDGNVWVSRLPTLNDHHFVILNVLPAEVVDFGSRDLCAVRAVCTGRML